MIHTIGLIILWLLLWTIVIISIIIMDFYYWYFKEDDSKIIKPIIRFLYWLFKAILTWSIFIPLIVIFSIIGTILGILYQFTIEPLIDQFRRRDHIIEVLTEDVLPE